MHKTMNDLKQKLINQIKKGEIKQTSRWYFMTKDYVFYCATAIAVLLGSVAVSSILFQAVTEYWVPLRAVPVDTKLFFIVTKTIPFVWVFALIVLIVLAWLNFKNTARAYRHHNMLIVAGTIIFSLVGGVGLFLSGQAERI